MSGYIKDYRKEITSDIWMMPPLYHRVWQYLKYMANHKTTKIPMENGDFFTIEAGQHLTSTRGIAKGVAWYEGRVYKEPNPRTISKILNWLEKVKMITIDRGRGNREYTLVTIVNWGIYQGSDDEGVTANTQASKQRVHINKNEKNDYIKDIYNIYAFWNEMGITKHRELTKVRESKIKAKLKLYTLEEIKQTIENYNTILKSDLYYFTHKFTLERFLDSAIFDQFITENKPFEKFLRKRGTGYAEHRRSDGRYSTSKRSDYEKLVETLYQ